MGGRSYSQDLRSRVLASDDLSARQAAVRFKVSVSYVIKARQRRDRTGEIGTRPRGSRRLPVLTAHGPAYRGAGSPAPIDHPGRSAGMARA